MTASKAAKAAKVAEAADRPTELPSPAAARGRTVTVACKIDVGLVLQLQTKMMKPEAVRSRDGMEDQLKPMEYWVRTGKKWYVAGPAYPVGEPPEGFPEKPILAGGYAMTPGIPADFWDQWLAQNKRSDYVESGMIFAMSDLQDAVAKGKEQAALTSGMQPISRAMKDGALTDPRLPKPINLSIAKVATAPQE